MAKGFFTNTLETFWSKVNKSTDSNGCWIWTGGTNKDGYGRFTYHGKRMLVHCFVYELKIGKIPDGLVLDHTCRNRRCVNPAHLEPVTSIENVLRGMSLFAQKKRQTHCIRGHLLAGSNLRIRNNGTRFCRTCDRNRHRNIRKAGNYA